MVKYVNNTLKSVVILIFMSQVFCEGANVFRRYLWTEHLAGTVNGVSDLNETFLSNDMMVGCGSVWLF